MSDAARNPDERLWELLAERAESGLSPEQQSELTDLIERATQSVDEDGLDLAAAVAYRVFEEEAGVVHEPMPEALSDRMIELGMQKVASHAQPQAPAPLPFPNQTSVTPSGLSHPALGWLAAAAVLALCVTAWIVMSTGQSTPDYMAQRAQLLQQANDVTQTDWAPSDDPVYGQVTGNVVWSDTKQQGYMLLDGLPVNDPSVEQYQLWIVDPDVDTHPVDGGVFDVLASGEVVVPIDAKLPVDKPTVFAITVEKPGGVVVSAGPLRVVAAVGT